MRKATTCAQRVLECNPDNCANGNYHCPDQEYWKAREEIEEVLSRYQSM